MFIDPPETTFEIVLSIFVGLVLVAAGVCAAIYSGLFLYPAMPCYYVAGMAFSSLLACLGGRAIGVSLFAISQ